MSWLIPAVLALVSWGIWGLLLKLASKHYRWHEIQVISSAFALVFAAALHLYFRTGISLDSPGLRITLAAGLFGALALAAFYSALEVGEASIVVPLTALYPAITVILSTIFLKERITMTQGVGIVLAVLAVLLLSTGQ